MSRVRFNPPGLNWLNYRLGTHASILASMKARLASADHPELAALTTREGPDPSIALLDAWAAVADVLTFYAQRDANEGFLRTATEERSIFELARLIGYRQRPGVAASVFLAYGLEKDARVTIPGGSKVQSVPGPGQLPQTYETSGDLVARAEWSAIRPRLGLPQQLPGSRTVYVKGASLGLKPNDPLLFVEGAGEAASPMRFARIHSTDSDFTRDVTRVVLQPGPVEGVTLPLTLMADPISTPAGPPPPPTFASATLAVANRFRGVAPAADVFMKGLVDNGPVDAAPATQLTESSIADVLAALDPRVSSEALQTVASRTSLTPPQPIRIYAFRVHSGPFGHNAAKRPIFERNPNDANNQQRIVAYQEWAVGGLSPLPPGTLDAPPVNLEGEHPVAGGVGFEASNTITLDAVRDGIVPESWVAIIRPEEAEKPSVLTLWRAGVVDTVSRGNYGVSGRATRIELRHVDAEGVDIPKDLVVGKDWEGWLQPEVNALQRGDRGVQPPSLAGVRRTMVYAHSERLELVEAPNPQPVDGTLPLELDGFYPGIDTGRWLIVEGERDDVLAGLTHGGDTDAPDSSPSSGIRAAELVQITRVLPSATHGPGDAVHTHVYFSPPLANSYKRDTVTIYANVVAATHGETRQEVLGSGDASSPYQTFTLKQGPLTFVPATTPSGVASTLEVRVNDLKWRETPALIDATRDDRVFVAARDEDGDVRVTFGDGTRGARVPTGVENVRARYRVGIGAAGNAAAGQVAQLMDRPLGAKDVRNPLPALGGADPDSARRARALAPLTVHALDRLVSAIDYERFAQLFAGIAKARASEIWSGTRTKIVVAVAAEGGLAIQGSALQASLVSALRRFGDPSRAVEVVDVQRHLLVLRAGVKLFPEYQFAAVRPKLEAGLFETFGFEQRRLGDDLPLSQVLAVMHAVPGVRAVDIDVFTTLSAADVVSESAFDARIAALTGEHLPADRLPVGTGGADGAAADRAGGWLVYLSPAVPRSVLLEEIA